MRTGFIHPASTWTRPPQMGELRPFEGKPGLLRNRASGEAGRSGDWYQIGTGHRCEATSLI